MPSCSARARISASSSAEVQARPLADEPMALRPYRHETWVSRCRPGAGRASSPGCSPGDWRPPGPRRVSESVQGEQAQALGQELVLGNVLVDPGDLEHAVKLLARDAQLPFFVGHDAPKHRIQGEWERRDHREPDAGPGAGAAR